MKLDLPQARINHKTFYDPDSMSVLVVGGFMFTDTYDVINVQNWTISSGNLPIDFWWAGDIIKDKYGRILTFGGFDHGLFMEYKNKSFSVLENTTRFRYPRVSSSSIEFVQEEW